MVKKQVTQLKQSMNFTHVEPMSRFEHLNNTKFHMKPDLFNKYSYKLSHKYMTLCDNFNTPFEYVPSM